MVVLHETIPTKKEIEEGLAMAAGMTALSGPREETRIDQQHKLIPASLMELNGLPHESLTPGQWCAIAKYQEPEVYVSEPLVVPGSEEAMMIQGVEF